MRRVSLSMQVTVDGFISGPNGEMDWICTDDELWQYVTDQCRNVDTALIGSGTWPGFSSYWQAAPTNPASSVYEVNYAHWIENTPKLVFSRTLEKSDWKNTRIVRGNIAEEIAALKQQPGKNLAFIGGAALAQTFMKLGLIDEYHLIVNPVILGSGKRLFGDMSKTTLRLVETKQFSSGIVLLSYEPDRK